MTQDKRQPDLFDAQAAAQQGMDRAMTHAERANPGWGNQAFGHLRDFAACHDEFLAEEARVWAIRQGMPKPPDSRAWGGIVSRAARAGMLTAQGFKKSRLGPGHARPMQNWKSNICGRVQP